MPFAEARGVSFHAVLARTPCVISGDPDRLQQVLWNLFSNAVKFSPPKTGRVEVRLERTDTQARIFVMDNGKGIAPEFMPQIFQRFTQAETSAGRVQGGLGLGLAIVRHTVDLHGGNVSAESAGLGHGATFCVSLPLTRASLPENAANGDVPVSMRLDGLRVLLVEDEADTREYLVKVLRDNGATVTAVENVKDAMSEIGKAPPDIVVSDIGLPGEDGYSLAQRLKQMAAEMGRVVPAIALTAHARQEDRLFALKSGFQLHVPKPVEPAHLVSVVANAARRG
jgi:CheY-like chemotaxis protein